MTQVYKGMEPLTGFPSLENFEVNNDADLERQYPGLREIFDYFLHTQVPDYIFDSAITNRREFPIQALVALPDADGGALTSIAGAITTTNRDTNSLRHAEFVAIDKALGRSRSKHLPEGSILLSMVEPCGMCAGALHHAGGRKVIYGASQRDIDGLGVAIDGVRKPFRTEPIDYSAKEYLLARDSGAVVLGGYRKREILQFISDGIRLL